MNTEIHILCNSAPCLKELSSGRWENMDRKNIFTCNLAYNFFRTEGRHLNIFTDAEPIKAFLEQENWPSVYDTWKYKKVEFIFSAWELFIKKISPVQHPSCTANFKYMATRVPGSSAINALLYLCFYEKYSTIYLIGYTINEWEGIENVKELAEKKAALQYLNQTYKQTIINDFVYRYDKR